MRGRREYLKVIYWGRIIRDKKDKRMVYAVYENSKMKARAKTTGKNWSREVKRIMEEMGLGGLWERETVGNSV